MRMTLGSVILALSVASVPWVAFAQGSTASPHQRMDTRVGASANEGAAGGTGRNLSALPPQGAGGGTAGVGAQAAGASERTGGGVQQPAPDAGTTTGAIATGDERSLSALPPSTAGGATQAGGARSMGPTAGAQGSLSALPTNSSGASQGGAAASNVGTKASQSSLSALAPQAPQGTGGAAQTGVAPRTNSGTATTPAATVAEGANANNSRGGGRWGWIGLVGLLGLAGLRPRQAAPLPATGPGVKSGTARL